MARKHGALVSYKVKRCGLLFEDTEQIRGDLSECCVKLWACSIGHCQGGFCFLEGSYHRKLPSPVTPYQNSVYEELIGIQVLG
jgi:hypothetical protein